MNLDMKPVNILPEVYNKIMFWVDKCPKEVGGFGKVIVKDGSYWIISAHLLKQEVTGTETEIDDVALGELMSETITEEGHLNFWWHSHVDMGTSWSGTDRNTIRDLGKNGMLLATVFNKRHEHRTAYHQGGDDFFPSLEIDNLKLNIVPMLDDSVNAEWEKEMKLKVKEKVYKQQRGSHYHNPQYDPNNWEGGSGYFFNGKWMPYNDADIPMDHKVIGTVGEAANETTLTYRQVKNKWNRVAKTEKKKWNRAFVLSNGYAANDNSSFQLINFYWDNMEFDIDSLITQYEGV